MGATPNAAEVLVGTPKVSGGVYSGATSATLPTDASTALDTSLAGLGYAGDSGLVQTIGTDTSPVKAWGGSTVRTLRTSHDVSYKVTLIESNKTVLAEVYGLTNIATAAGVTTVKINPQLNGPRAFVFDMLDGTANIRVVVPNGQITAVGDVSYVDGDPIDYEITISAYPDATGNKAYLYLQPAVVS